MIGTRLSIIRKQKKLSYRQLAKITGFSHSFLCDIEKGRSKPSIETLLVLSQALEVQPNFFLTKVVVGSDRNNLKPTGTDK